MSIIDTLNANRATILAGFFLSENIEKQLKDFPNIIIFVPSDRILRLFVNSTHIPLVKLVKLNIFKDVIINHFINKITYKRDGKTPRLITSLNDNTFAFNGKFLDDVKTFVVKGELEVNGIKLYFIDGLLTTNQQRSNLKSTYFESLPYDIFLKIVETGDIRGQDLFNLCNTSSKLQLYCTDRNEYLFRRLLDKEGISPKIYPHLSPKQAYKNSIVGGKISILNKNDETIPLYTNFNVLDAYISYFSTYLIDSYDNLWSIRNEDDQNQVQVQGQGFFDYYALQKLDYDKEIKTTHIKNIKAKAIVGASDFSGIVLIDENNDLLRMKYDTAVGKFNFTRIQIVNDEEIKFIDISGSTHFLCLDNRGGVWGFGSNYDGRLGLGPTANGYQQDIVKIPGFGNKVGEIFIVAVSAGTNHSLFLDKNGNVYSCGTNTYGQLGFSKGNKDKPSKIANLQKIIAICAGGGHSLCLDSDGYVWGFGLNESGQTGSQAKKHSYKPTRVIITHNSTRKEIVAISASTTSHSLLLTKDGLVYRLGNDMYNSRSIRNGNINKDVPKLLDLGEINGRVFKIWANSNDAVLWN